MKNKFKKLTTILIVCLFIVFLYSIIHIIRSGKQVIILNNVSNYYSGSEIDALVEVVNRKNGDSLKSNLTVELLNNDNKKVKGVKEKYKIDKEEQAEVSLSLPEDIENGKYILKVTSKSGFYKEKLEVPINIIGSKSSETIISLDKGIYKPGDTINYRVLMLSKKDNTPLSANEITINIFDGNDNRVYSENTQTSDFGIVSGTFTLSDTVNSGTYKITVSSLSEEKTKTFTVNPYVTPKFEVSVNTDKDVYIVGETANITVNAKYFFGEPVKNASVIGTIDEEEFKGITDEAGNLVKTIEVKEDGTHTIKLSVEDSSNYFIEANKTFIGATDVFELEALFEYSNYVKGLDNDVYIITKTADNKPIKTYVTVKVAGLVRDVITDENGVGKLTLSSADITKSGGSETLYITAENMEGQTVYKEVPFSIVTNSGTIVETDKIKYNENETINVSLTSVRDNVDNTIYVFKGNELIKTLHFEGNETDFNLGDISGLIDIYTPSGTLLNNIRKNTDISYLTKTNYESASRYNQKTIFIKPSKSLDVEVKTDKDTYAPKDTLNISFKVSNENNDSTDAALLVSILDEAVLSLADNDLSIDNLKVALGDIKLTDGITAADLYAMILDDSNSTALNSILLKQYVNRGTDIIITKSYSEDLNIYRLAAIVSAIILIFIIFGTILKNHPKTRTFIWKALIAIIDIIAIFVISSIYITPVIEDIFWSMYLGELALFAINAVIAIIVYNLILYKQKDYIFNLIFNFAFIPFIAYIVIMIFTEITGFYQLPLIAALSLVLLLCGLIRTSFTKELNRFWTIVKNSLIVLAKSCLFWVAVYLVCEFFDSIWGFIVIIAAYVFYEKYILGKTKTKLKDGKIIINITGNELISILVGIIFVIIVVVLVKSLVGGYAGSVIEDSIVYETNSRYDASSSSSSSSGRIKFYDFSADAVSSDAQDSTGAASSSFGFGSFGSSVVSDVIDSFSTSTITDSIGKAENSDQSVSEISKDISIEENVRNVFLESLAFIPELVTSDGKANLDLKISDNITTWNIQTVGNSKDGRLGYGSGSFKVFKEFFVDFSLPTNTVVTDKISIPVTVYNYTDSALDVNLNVVENDWTTIGEYSKLVNVPANSTQMIYVPVEIIKEGNNTLRIESQSGNVSDIVEKQLSVSVNGFEKQTLVSSGSTEKKLEQDILFREEAIEGTQKIKVKLYPTTIAQVVENMDAILQMPSGCFEQTSSSLYPDLLALKYLRDNNLSDERIETKAQAYISAGYQKLLTYEVKGTKGGYSLYGSSPAEPVITAFGLMEMNDLSKVYEVDKNVIENMKEYLFSVQKYNGSFDYNSTYIGGATSTSDLAMNAYITWALSEVCPNDSRLQKSVKYLTRYVDDTYENYTLALMANVFINTNNENAKIVLNRLIDDIETVNNDSAFVRSTVKGYLGTYGHYQDMQATALTSLALTKDKSNAKTNSLLVNYIIKNKDTRGTWYNTQSTILALKAINDYNDKTDATEQVVTVSLNGENKDIKIGENVLDMYEVEFTDVKVENKFSLSMKSGQIYYEIVKEYYEEYDKTLANYSEKTDGVISISQELTRELSVNDILSENIIVINSSGNDISNAIVRITIPQGCSVIEDSLLQLEYENKIEKFEYNYNTLDLYLRNFEKNESVDLTINYRASFPEEVTGAAIRVYDYYNPDVEGICMPSVITVR